jgi:hypothetical protein
MQSDLAYLAMLPMTIGRHGSGDAIYHAMQSRGSEEGSKFGSVIFNQFFNYFSYLSLMK